MGGLGGDVGPLSAFGRHAGDGVEFSFGDRSVELPFESFMTDSLAQPEAPNAVEFLELLNAWGRVTVVLNELSRSMGLPDFYPFVLSRDAVAKLHFVHTVLTSVHS